MARPAIQAEAVVSSDIDTQSEIVPTPPPGVSPPDPRHRWWAIPLVVVSAVALVVVLVASVLPASLVAETTCAATNDECTPQPAPYARVPSSAEPVEDRISFDAVPRYPSDGSLLFVTVREPPLTLLDAFAGREQFEIDPLSREDKFGRQTPAQQRQIGVQMMRTAKETAQYVALKKLGFPVEMVPGDVIVAQLLCLEANEAETECLDWAPSDDLLDPGDKLIEVDGVELKTLDDLSPILKRHQPGDMIEIRFDRPGSGEQSGSIELIGDPDDPTRTLIGFVPVDTAQAELPFDVTINSGAIGGPSAGLAFTLTLLDELTPGELTGGAAVAVTGTIDSNANVGAIGGLVQKASAVKQTGAKVFIVPFAQGERNIADARKVAGSDLTIIPVKTLDEALAALAELGGNGLELGTPGTTFTAGT